jgi:hypothetical protein
MKISNLLQGRRFEADSADYVSSFACAFAEAQEKRPPPPSDPSEHAGFDDARSHQTVLSVLNPGLVAMPEPAQLIGSAPLEPLTDTALQHAIQHYENNPRRQRNRAQREAALAVYRQEIARVQSGELPVSD